MTLLEDRGVFNTTRLAWGWTPRPLTRMSNELGTEVTSPLSLPGILAGSLLVFALGATGPQPCASS